LVYHYESLKFCRFDGTRLVNMYSGEETTQLLASPPISIRKIHSEMDSSSGEQQNRAR